MAIEKFDFYGYDAIKLTFNTYEATILYGRGCNLIRFQDTSDQTDFLHVPSADEFDEFQVSPQRFGCAPLFFPNVIVDGRFTRDGIEYNFDDAGLPYSHGILKEVAFDLDICRETEDLIYVKCTFNSMNTPYYTAFQWLFECSFEYTLSASGLTQSIHFHNPGDVLIPFGVGYHTSFAIPQNSAFQASDYKVMVSAKTMWETNNLIPTGKQIPLLRDYPSGFLNPLKETIAEHLHASSDSKFHGAVITNIATGKQIVYETDPFFTEWMIWNNRASRNYICIEPMTWTINAPNATYPDEVSGFQYLAPTKSWSATNRFYSR